MRLSEASSRRGEEAVVGRGVQPEDGEKAEAGSAFLWLIPQSLCRSALAAAAAAAAAAFATASASASA